MGLSLKGIGKGIKKVGKAIGKVVPGVGSLIGGAMIPGGGALIGSAVQGGKKQILSDMGKGVRNAATLIPGMGATGDLAAGLGKIPGVAKVGGAAKGVWDKIPGSVKEGIGGMLQPDNMLGIAGTVDAANQRRRATDLENQGLNRIRGSWDSKQGLRDMSMAGLMRPEGDIGSRLGDVYRRDPGNPYDMPPVVPAGGVPAGGVRSGPPGNLSPALQRRVFRSVR